MPRNPVSLIGRRYGLLVVVKLLHRNKFGNSRWLCECDCGNTHEAFYQNLKGGRATSCGCARKKDLE